VQTDEAYVAGFEESVEVHTYRCGKWTVDSKWWQAAEARMR
jgi:hypothetical protein